MGDSKLRNEVSNLRVTAERCERLHSMVDRVDYDAPLGTVRRIKLHRTNGTQVVLTTETIDASTGMAEKERMESTVRALLSRLDETQHQLREQTGRIDVLERALKKEC
jgi:hypothetical protein